MRNKLIKSLFMSLVLILAFALPVFAYTPGIRGPLILIAADSKYTYLGQLTSDKYSVDSVFNEYGLYGSRYAANSIANEYGLYGSKYSSYSPFSQYTTSPPYIVDADGDIVGRLSVNKYVPGAVNPLFIFDILKKMGL